MSCICYVIIWICFYILSGIALSSEKRSFAFTGCNAVLEWSLGISSVFDLLITTVSIKDNNGSVIIPFKESNCSCQDEISMKCNVSERDGFFFISVIIINVSKEHLGNYTALIRKGFNKSTVQKQLLVIDKPRIMENKQPVLHESFSITCNTSYEADCLTYHWRTNDVYQNYTASIQGDSSTLTFENLTMVDNSSRLTCHVGIENCADVDFTIRNCSSEESDLYTVLPYYVTVFSSPPGENQGLRLEQYWLVPVIVSGFLLTAGFVILFKCWRKIAGRGKGIRPVPLYAAENGEKNDATFNPDTGTQLDDLSKSTPDYCGPNFQEGIYTTIDESAESAYCYARDGVSERNFNATGSSTGHGYNRCTTSMEMCHRVKADVHVPDEGNTDYLTPLSDLSSHVEMCENRETNQSGTDQTTMTSINEFFCPNEAHVCQDEQIEVSEIDHSYITPIV